MDEEIATQDVPQILFYLTPEGEPGVEVSLGGVYDPAEFGRLLFALQNKLLITDVREAVHAARIDHPVEAAVVDETLCDLFKDMVSRYKTRPAISPLSTVAFLTGGGEK